MHHFRKYTLPSDFKITNIEVELRNRGYQTVRLSPVGLGAHVSVLNRLCSFQEYGIGAFPLIDRCPSFQKRESPTAFNERFATGSISIS